MMLFPYPWLTSVQNLTAVIILFYGGRNMIGCAWLLLKLFVQEFEWNIHSNCDSYFSLFGCFILMVDVAIIIRVQKVFEHLSGKAWVTLGACANSCGTTYLKNKIQTLQDGIQESLMPGPTYPSTLALSTSPLLWQTWSQTYRTT